MTMQTGPRNWGRRDPDATADLATSNTVSLAIDQMRSAHRGVRAAEREAVEKAAACGRLLIDMKNRIGEREWPAFVRDHSGFTMTTAQSYLKLAKFVEDPAKAAQVENLRLAEIEIMLAAQRMD